MIAPAATVPDVAPVTVAAVAPAGNRLQGLDGLRGLAMLMVIVCHLNLLGIGWTGLSSFFVLSGFLITRILLSDREESDSLGGYFRRFYTRRTLRVFPIYYVYLILVTIGTFAIPALARIKVELPAAFLYLYNLRMIGEHEHTRMLGHLWSLSVEEQFYLVWPWLIAFVPRRYIPYVCAALIGLGPLIRVWECAHLFPSWGMTGPRPQVAAYVFTLSHLDAFAFGALINFVQWRPKGWQILAFMAAAFALGFAVNGSYGQDSVSLGWPLFMHMGYQYTWGYTVVDFFWMMIICAILGRGGVKRFFSLPVLDYLGQRSYSTYIFHFPVMALMEPLWLSLMKSQGRLLGTLEFMVPYLLVVFTVSGLAFRFIEMPINALKDRFRASRKLSASAAGKLPA